MRTSTSYMCTHFPKHCPLQDSPSLPLPPSFSLSLSLLLSPSLFFSPPPSPLLPLSCCLALSGVLLRSVLPCGVLRSGVLPSGVLQLGVLPLGVFCPWRLVLGVSLLASSRCLKSVPISVWCTNQRLVYQSAYKRYAFASCHDFGVSVCETSKTTVY